MHIREFLFQVAKKLEGLLQRVVQDKGHVTNETICMLAALLAFLVLLEGSFLKKAHNTVLEECFKLFHLPVMFFIL